MQIANNILKHQLQHVYFITGTAYAGKSTAVQRLAQRYGLVPCGENYHSALSDRVADPVLQPTRVRSPVLQPPSSVYHAWCFRPGVCRVLLIFPIFLPADCHSCLYKSVFLPPSGEPD